MYTHIVPKVKLIDFGLSVFWQEDTIAIVIVIVRIGIVIVIIIIISSSSSSIVVISVGVTIIDNIISIIIIMIRACRR